MATQSVQRTSAAGAVVIRWETDHPTRSTNPRISQRWKRMLVQHGNRESGFGNRELVSGKKDLLASWLLTAHSLIYHIFAWSRFCQLLVTL
ncbi:MAG: hypothetical protein JNJ94_16190 [Chlorobi bacterium]|nr:hypothetical protein [Chlorobiota bacterium]